MRIFIDIGHPAHVHYYKNFIKIMEKKGHDFFITARDKDCTLDLLKFNRIKYVNRGSGANSLLGKIFYTIKADLLILYYSIKFKPNVYISHFSMYTAHVAALLRKYCILTGDTDSNTSHKYAIPLISSFLCPISFKYNYGAKQIFFDSFMELMYLHPNYFRPEKKNINNLLPNNTKKNVLLRFVSWNAHHDVGLQGIPINKRKELIEKLEPYCNIFISSECELDSFFKKYQLNIESHLMHHFLASIDFILSESATMSSECAVLGTPAIYFDKMGRCYTNEQEEKYNLVWNFKNCNGIIDKALQMAKTENLKVNLKQNYNKLINDKIDPTEFLIWFVENYPKSRDIMKNDYNNKKIK